MTQEERKLLLLDLSARLFCNVIVKQYSSINGYVNNNGETTDVPLNELIHNVFERKFLTIRPYLRSMSSMTENEKREYNKLLDDCKEQDLADYNITTLVDSMLFFVIDWLNEHHFDYRGLINLGLALEAPKGMYRI